MVQVDVFWGYGWGASLAAAAGPALVKEPKPFESKYFVWTVLFLSLFWAPTGMLLLLRHPSWETMQAATSFSAMSEWLVLAFGITNITQGILGFAVGYWLLKRREFWLVHLNWIVGYYGMFFILLYGWDGLGYDRFLYDRGMVAGQPAWTPGVGTASGVPGALGAFLTSGVAFTLYTDGVWLIPPFIWLGFSWGRARAPEAFTAASAFKVVVAYAAGIFVLGFGGAAFSALTVRGVGALLGVGDNVARGLGQIPRNTVAHVISYVLGIPVSLGVLWFSVLKPGRVGERMLAAMVDK